MHHRTGHIREHFHTGSCDSEGLCKTALMNLPMAYPYCSPVVRSLSFTMLLGLCAAASFDCIVADYRRPHRSLLRRLAYIAATSSPRRSRRAGHSYARRCHEPGKKERGSSFHQLVRLRTLGAAQGDKSGATRRAAGNLFRTVRQGNSACRQSIRGLVSEYGGVGPAGLNFSIENTVDQPMTMYVINEPTPPGFRPNTSLLARDENELPISSSKGMWAHIVKTLFVTSDGLATLQAVLTVTLDPLTSASRIPFLTKNGRN